jgi:hypothetical protein
MSLETMKEIVDALWAEAGAGLYAVLDAARDPVVLAKVLTSDVQSICLYEGSISHELAAVAPYLVKLRRGDALTTWLVEEGWGKSWGVFARSAQEMENVRRHFRRLLRVKDESGRTLLFRYYDPRVLRVYLPTCNEKDTPAVFGPLSAYLVEGEGGRSMNVYTNVDGTCVMERPWISHVSRALQDRS